MSDRTDNSSRDEVTTAFDAKVAIDFARSLATILVALAALGLTTVSLLDIAPPDEPVSTDINVCCVPVQYSIVRSNSNPDQQVRASSAAQDAHISLFGFSSSEKALILLFCSASLIVAARVVDWIMDRLHANFWRIVSANDAELNNLYNRSLHVKNARERPPLDGAWFRFHIFGSGYFALVVFISFSASVGVWHAVFFLQQEYYFIDDGTLFEWLLSILLFCYMVFQMMTIESKNGTLFFVISLAVCFGIGLAILTLPTA